MSSVKPLNPLHLDITENPENGTDSNLDMSASLAPKNACLVPMRMGRQKNV